MLLVQQISSITVFMETKLETYMSRVGHEGCAAAEQSQ